MNIRNRLLKVVGILELMHINIMEAHTFEIIPSKPYTSDYIHELFGHVKRGHIQAVEEILMDGYRTSSAFLKGSLHNYKHMSNLYSNPAFDKSVI